MNPIIRDQWASALESGEYTQGTGKLTKISEGGTRNHCCLGVLCELAVKAGVLPEGQVYEDEYEQTTCLQYGAEENSSFLPAEVREWAGIGLNSVALEHKGSTWNADFHNDVNQVTFPTLAGLIRTQL